MLCSVYSLPTGIPRLPWLRVFRAFSLSCKGNARVKLAKTGHGPHSSTISFICVVRLLYVLLFVLFYVLFVCKCVLPPGDNPIAVNKYIKFQGITRKDRAQSAIILISELCCSKCCLCRLCCSMCCLCVNVYCTTATGWLLNCSYIYHIVTTQSVPRCKHSPLQL